jgi:molybdopterin-binding protein
MQSALSTDCVYNVVNIFLGKAKLKAVTLENGLVLQYHGDRHIGPSIITARSAREMQLKPGQTAAALIKATEVMILRV